MNEWMVKWTDEWIDGEMGRWAGKEMAGKWADVWIEGWIGRWMIVG